MTTSPTIRRNRFRLLQLVVLLFAVGFVGRVLGQRVSTSSPGFADEPLEALREQDAQYIFIGNSMLGTRIDATELSNRLGGQEVAILENGGSASAMWYLQFKNYVVASKARPKRVIFFFRDAYLTDPLYRTTGKYSKRLAETARKEEPILELVLSGAAHDWRFRTLQTIQRVIPLHRYRETLDESLDRLGTMSLRACCETRSREATLATVNKVFQVDNLRKVARDDAADQNRETLFDFQKASRSSFLPHIIELARDHDIPLFFVRVQSRPPVKEAPKLTNYMEALELYLEVNRAGFIDLSRGDTAPLGWYGKGDHIGAKHRRRYTKWFRTRAKAVFRGTKP